MQMAFFQLTTILPLDEAIRLLKQAIANSYGSKGQALVERNWQALAATSAALTQVPLGEMEAGSRPRPPVVSPRRRTSCRPSPPPCWRGLATACRSPPSP